MWITKLQLRDIKSYGPDSPVIEFREGVNLIQGKNGAGKSTILEAIGLALFDSKQYKLGDFVREGARTGTIMVGFVSALDEREYEVVRSIGGSNQTYVHDPELNRKLVEGREDTLAFIHQHLGVEQGIELAALFADAVGVPQGMMTAIFREPAGQRKQKFDRLLHIDVYERVWSSLLKTGNYISQLRQQNENQQSELRGALLDRPEVEARVTVLAEKLDADQTELDRITAELELLQARLTEVDALKKQLDTLERQTRDAEAEFRQAETRLGVARLALEEALQAADVVAKTEEGHRTWEAARTALEADEQDRQIRDALLREQNEVKLSQSAAQEALRQILDELQRVAAAEATLQELKSQVERYSALLEKRDSARQASLEYNRQRQRIDEQTGVRNGLASRLTELTVALKAEGYALPQVAATGGEALEILAANAVAGAENALAGWRTARQTVQAIEIEVRDLEETFIRRAETQSALANVEAERERLRSDIAILQGTLHRLEREQQTLNEHETLLGETGAICPVCRQPVDSHAQAEASAHYAAERNRLQIAIEKENTSLADAQRELAVVEERHRKLAADLAGLAGPAELESARSRYSGALQAADQRADHMQAACGEAAGYLLALDNLLEETQANLEALSEQAAELGTLEAELAVLSDPRTSFALAEAEVARHDEVQARFDAKSAELAELAADLDRITQEMAPYADLDERMAALRQQLSASAEAHERFVASRGLAAQVSDRQQTVEALEKEYTSLEATHLALLRDRDATAAEYDGEAHITLQGEVRALELEQTGIAARLEGNRSALAEAQARLDRLATQAAALAVAEQQAGRLQARQEAFEFVRKAIRDAGPRVTQQLVRMISEHANHLFGDILGDHSLILSWSEDYAISVNNRGEERGFDLLSGGEQMVAALAVRLALLTQLANVRFAFFDEPTANLDDTRRQQLAERLAEIRSLRQLFVISHDDTFEQESYHVIQVHKENGVSQVEIL